MGKKKAAKKATIEDAMEELQEIVAALEAGHETLDDSLSKYERGMHLLRDCHRQLDAAAQRIEIVTGASEDGDIVTEPFDTESTQDKERSSGRDSEEL